MKKGDMAIAIFNKADGPVYGKILMLDINRKYVTLEIGKGIQHAGYYVDIKKGSLFHG